MPISTVLRWGDASELPAGLAIHTIREYREGHIRRLERENVFAQDLLYDRWARFLTISRSASQRATYEPPADL